MFYCEKTAQCCAFFAICAGGGINILKLMKLLYLAERESLRRFDAPITYDRFVSMDHGPVLSATYNLLNGDARGECAEKWDRWVGKRVQHDIYAQTGVTEPMLDRLCKAEVELMHEIWRDFGSLDQWQLSDYTHKFPEWRDPQSSSLPISIEEILRAVGKSKEIAAQLAAEIRGWRTFVEL